ncbi:MAG: MBL fold metallo-hydrolase [Gammaproteobacteria bacterium]|nr:MBL fold metallo-hydrolase [Gammaproteobacteria bacterium]
MPCHSLFANQLNAEQQQTKFKNTELEYKTNFSDLFKMIKAYWNDTRSEPVPNIDVPVTPIDIDKLVSETEDALFRLGHSTVLVRLDQEFILFDPVFSERASPVQWMGPKRFHQSPIDIPQLPKIKAVIISHDHYDHLDGAAIEQLNDKVELFITPLKVGDYLRDWGVEDDKIVELNWWQHVQLGTIKVTATPSQHFSGRGLFDRDKTLWASWVLQGWESKLFFSGDSGYFNGFKEIGERLGPFDITMIETGAYNTLWPDIHMFPEQCMQAHIDLRGTHMLPIHNGTFDLSLHNWFEPFDEIMQLAKFNQVSLLTPKFGEKISVQMPQVIEHWWQAVKNK